MDSQPAVHVSQKPVEWQPWLDVRCQHTSGTTSLMCKFGKLFKIPKYYLIQPFNSNFVIHARGLGNFQKIFALLSILFLLFTQAYLVYVCKTIHYDYEFCNYIWLTGVFDYTFFHILVVFWFFFNYEVRTHFLCIWKKIRSFKCSGLVLFSCFLCFVVIFGTNCINFFDHLLDSIAIIRIIYDQYDNS